MYVSWLAKYVHIPWYFRGDMAKGYAPCSVRSASKATNHIWVPQRLYSYLLYMGIISIKWALKWCEDEALLGYQELHFMDQSQGNIDIVWKDVDSKHSCYG